MVRVDPTCPRCHGKGRRLVTPPGRTSEVVWCECVPREDIAGRWRVPAWAAVKPDASNRDEG